MSRIRRRTEGKSIFKSFRIGEIKVAAKSRKFRIVEIRAEFVETLNEEGE